MAGTAPTLRASHAASIAAPTISSVPPSRISAARRRRCRAPSADAASSASSADMTDSTISSCWALLAAEPDDQQQAGRERPDDRADRVGGVDAADEPRRILAAVGDRGERQREAGAPENRGRQHRPQRAHQIELEREPGAARHRRIDRPVRQRLREHVRRPGDRAARAASGTQASASARPRDVARQRRADAAADAEAEQEHREDQREGVDRAAEEQRQDARPDDFRRERGHAGDADGDVDGPGALRLRDVAPRPLDAGVVGRRSAR